jgi:hypothetical protein
MAHLPAPVQRLPIEIKLPLRGAEVELIATTRWVDMHTIIVDSAELVGEKFIGYIMVDELNRVHLKTDNVYPLFHFAYVAALLAAHEAEVVKAFNSIRKPTRRQ